MCPEDRLRRADGSIDWVRWEIYPWRTNTNEIGGIMIFCEIITERKNAELALSAASQQVSNIIESITDAFIAIDSQWRYTYVNATAEKLLSRSRADLLGRSIWEYSPPRENPIQGHIKNFIELFPNKFLSSLKSFRRRSRCI
jgi:FOG: PAS/PAC domain